MLSDLFDKSCENVFSIRKTAVKHTNSGPLGYSCCVRAASNRDDPSLTLKSKNIIQKNKDITNLWEAWHFYSSTRLFGLANGLSLWGMSREILLKWRFLGNIVIVNKHLKSNASWRVHLVLREYEVSAANETSLPSVLHHDAKVVPMFWCVQWPDGYEGHKQCFNSAE